MKRCEKSEEPFHGMFLLHAKLLEKSMANALTVSFFTAPVKFVLLYGREAWTPFKQLEHKVNVAYTRIIREVKQVHWSSDTINA